MQIEDKEALAASARLSQLRSKLKNNPVYKACLLAMNKSV
jgi:hypothetical protein